jgi:DNA polymerase-3 subunit alpha
MESKMSNIKSITYVGEEDTYDLEVEHADHQYYLANGILTSNSHSISYSLISFHTAWLRHHYPTEFMTALINSEDPNSDKIQEYLSECNNMGIEILPPDVNNSKGLYSILEEGKILTGFSAIKGVGEKAIESIVKNQPYHNFGEFIFKNDSKAAGKTVIQALSKAGAFDLFMRSRKDIHENYQKHRTKVKASIKKVLEQHAKVKNPDYSKLTAKEKTEFLDEIELEIPFEQVEAIIRDVDLGESVPEWEQKEVLLFERETLGRAISGSLHSVFKSFFSGGPMVTPLSRVQSMGDGSRIKIEAIIKTKIKEFKIKNGKNIGKKFAKYLIEDVNGDTCGLTLWADDYEKYRGILKEGLPIKAICSVNNYLDQKDLALSSLERVYGREI